MGAVRRSGVLLALVLPVALVSIAHADDRLDKLWPSLPADHAKPLEDVVVDNLSDLGNHFGDRLDTLSHDLIGLRIDGRGQRAHLRLGTGTGHYLSFKLDSDWLFSDDKARVNATVELGIGTHELELKLPPMDLTEQSYHGVDLVEVNIPLLERHF